MGWKLDPKQCLSACESIASSSRFQSIFAAPWPSCAFPICLHCLLVLELIFSISECSIFPKSFHTALTNFTVSQTLMLALISSSGHLLLPYLSNVAADMSSLSIGDWFWFPLLLLFPMAVITLLPLTGGDGPALSPPIVMALCSPAMIWAIWAPNINEVFIAFMFLLYSFTPELP